MGSRKRLYSCTVLLPYELRKEAGTAGWALASVNECSDFERTLCATEGYTVLRVGVVPLPEFDRISAEELAVLADKLHGLGCIPVFIDERVVEVRCGVCTSCVLVV